MLTLDAYKASSNNLNDSVSNLINFAKMVEQSRAMEREALLNQSKFATTIKDDKMRNDAMTRLANGFGISGFLKNAFGSRSDAEPVQNTTGLNMAEGSPVTWEQKALNPELMNTTNENIKNKYMNDNKRLLMGDDVTSKGLATGKYSMVNEGTPVAMSGNIKNSEQNLNVNRSDNMNIINQANDFNKRADAVAMDNRNIEAGNLKRQQIAEAKAYRDNPDAYYRDAIKDLYVDKFTGSQSNMIKQNQQMYERLIDLALSKKDYNRARQFNKEYKANLMNIDRNWGDERRDYPDLIKFDGGGKAEKRKLYTIKFSRPDGKGGYETASADKLLTDTEATNLRSKETIASLLGQNVDQRFLTKDSHYEIEADKSKAEVTAGKSKEFDDERNRLIAEGKSVSSAEADNLAKSGGAKILGGFLFFDDGTKMAIK